MGPWKLTKKNVTFEVRRQLLRPVKALPDSNKELKIFIMRDDRNKEPLLAYENVGVRRAESTFRCQRLPGHLSSRLGGSWAEGLLIAA